MSKQRNENIGVFLRIRPFNNKEKQRNEEYAVLITDEGLRINQNSLSSEICSTIDKYKDEKFIFDQLFEPESATDQIFKNHLSETITSTLNGFNSTVFVYGQTGSGKTHTLMGQYKDFVNTNTSPNENVFKSEEPKSRKLDRSKSPMKSNPKNSRNNSSRSIVKGKSSDNSISRVMDKKERDRSMGIAPKDSSQLRENLNKIDPKNEGVVFLGIKKLFSEISNDTENNYCVRMSYVEIYNENVFDLLSTPDNVKGNLQIIENTKTNDFWIKDVNEVIIADADEAVDLIMSGEENRHFAATELNHHSSRSHCLIRIFVQKIDSNETILEGICNFVDLAGSEKLSGSLEDKKKKAKGANEINSITDRLKESKAINKSLFFLTQIIYMKSRMSSAFIPYRNSALTKILKNSIGGNAQTFIVLCVNPLSRTLTETISTLKFGQRAKKIVNSVSKNKAKNGDINALKQLLADYEKKIEDMEKSMHEQKSQIVFQPRPSCGPRKSNLMQVIENLQGQKSMLESKLQRRSGLIKLFNKSQFNMTENEQKKNIKIIKQSVFNQIAGNLDFFIKESEQESKKNVAESHISKFKITDQQFVKEMLQDDFVNSVKKKNKKLQTENKKQEFEINKLKKELALQQKQNQQKNQLINILLNKTPESLTKFDSLSRDMILQNSIATLQNINSIKSIESLLKIENKTRHLEDYCMKIGFQYSQTYLTEQNLVYQLFGDVKQKQQIEMIRENYRKSMAFYNINLNGSNLSPNQQNQYLSNPVNKSFNNNKLDFQDNSVIMNNNQNDTKNSLLSTITDRSSNIDLNPASVKKNSEKISFLIIHKQDEDKENQTEEKVDSEIDFEDENKIDVDVVNEEDRKKDSLFERNSDSFSDQNNDEYEHQVFGTIENSLREDF